MIIKKITTMAFIASLILFNSCSGCVKSVAKKVTESGVAAIDGVNEALDENAERLGEATTTVAIKVLKGAGKSLEKELNSHAKYIEEQNGELIITAVDNINVEEINSFYQKISFEQNTIDGASVKIVGKLLSHQVLDTYILFSQKGDYNYKITLLNNGDTIQTKNTNILIDSIPQSKIISFSSQNITKIDSENCHVVVQISKN